MRGFTTQFLPPRLFPLRLCRCSLPRPAPFQVQACVPGYWIDEPFNGAPPGAPFLWFEVLTSQQPRETEVSRLRYVK
jgi:hypothetical protein